MRRSPTVVDHTLLPSFPRPHDGEKGKAGRGKPLHLAGPIGLPGAAILAALRVRCGTVRVAALRSVAVAIGVALPELMVLPLPETESGSASESALSLLERQVEACHAVVNGPGLGSDPGTDRLVVRFIVGSPLPMLIDAGALLAWS